MGTVMSDATRNVGIKDAETPTFPFVRIIASGPPVYSFVRGLFVR